MIGKVAKNGTPLNALILSTLGIAVATIIYVIFPNEAFTMMFAISMFGAMFTWFMIFVTHIAFRRTMKATGETLAYKLPGSTIGAVVGAILLLAVLISTAFTEEFRATIPFGIPCLIIVTIAFFAVKRNKAKVNTKA